MALGLTRYAANKLCVEVSTDGTAWREIIANGYVESSDTGDEEVVEAFKERSFKIIEAAAPQSINVAMETMQPSHPTHQMLAKAADDESNIWIRATYPKQDDLYPKAAGNTLAVAASGEGTGVGRTVGDIYDDPAAVAGLFFEHDPDGTASILVLSEKTLSSSEVKGVKFEAVDAVTGLNTDADAVYRPTLASPAAHAAETYRAFYPGFERVRVRCSIALFGNLDVQIGNRPQTVLQLEALTRFENQLVYTV